MFSDDLMIIDRLRVEAVNVLEPHVSGISRLVTYAAQLKWLGGKFPVDVSCLSCRSGVFVVKLGQDMLKYAILNSLLDRSGLFMVSRFRIQYIEAE